MPRDLILTDNGFEPFSLEEPSKKQFENINKAPEWAMPYLNTQEAWDNYSDDLVYEIDKRMREWLASMKNKWTRKGTDRRYTFSTLLDILGIDITENKLKNHNKVARIFAYYSTKIQKQTTINGIKRKNVYTVSAARLKRQPYSLKLRIEQMTEEGDWRSLRLPKDNLEVGHARNPRTEENIRRRSEAAKEKYHEYKRNWKSARQDGQANPSGHRSVHDESVSDENDGRDSQGEGNGN